jgi:hypothetical protein
VIAETTIVRDTIFVSYSHDDRRLLHQVLTVLAPLADNRRLRIWADPHIRAGSDWQRDIDAAVARTAIALLLVSPPFLASRFIRDTGLPSLVAADTVIVPALLRDCLWEEVPLLRTPNWAHDPGRDGAIAKASGAYRDERIVRICQRLIELLPSGPSPAEPGSSSTGSMTDGTRTRAHASAERAVAAPDEPPVTAALPRAGTPGRLDGVPPIPAGFVRRDELDVLRRVLLDEPVAAVGISGSRSGVGLAGQGGIGKTVLAAALASDDQLRSRFPDGVFWVTVGQYPDLVGTQLYLLDRLGQSPTEPVRTVRDGAKALTAALADCVPAGRRRRLVRRSGAGLPGDQPDLQGAVHHT